MTTIPNQPLERDCIIYLPGLGGGELVDQSIEGMARRLAHQMDNNAIDNTHKFTSKVKAVEDLPHCSGEVGTVFREDEAGESAVLDIYKLDYRNTLVERYESRNLFVKAILLLVALPGSVWRFLRAMISSQSAKTRVEKVQLLYALTILSLLVVYVVILLSAVWATLQELSWYNNLNNYIPEKFYLRPVVNGWFKLSQALVVIWAAVSILFPPKFNLKDIISKAAVDYLCLIYYLNLGEQRYAIIGQLEATIDQILRKSDTARKKKDGTHYRRIYLMAYSFGSIIALDAMFPQRKEPGRPFRSVHTLITIGCPFDFIRTFWADYFDSHRKFAQDCPVRWFNIYSPVDALASNFRNDPENSEATINIRSEDKEAVPAAPAPDNLPFDEGLSLTRLSWTNSLTLIGLRSHSFYWGTNPESEINCFGDLVPKLYEGEAVLD